MTSTITSRIRFSRYLRATVFTGDCDELTHPVRQVVLTRSPGAIAHEEEKAEKGETVDPLQTPEKVKGDGVPRKLGFQTTPAVLSAYNDRVEEDVVAVFRPGMIALMGQIHCNHLQKIVKMANLRAHKDEPGVCCEFGGISGVVVFGVCSGLAVMLLLRQLMQCLCILVCMCRLLTRTPLQPREPPWSRLSLIFTKFTAIPLAQRKSYAESTRIV